MAAEQDTAEAPLLSPDKIEKLKPEPETYEVRDAAARGLRLRVTSSGVKVFRWHTTGPKPDGTLGQKVVTLGRWSKKPRPGHVTLAEARKLLEDLKVAHKEGRLEAEVAKLAPARRASSATTAAGGVLTVRDVAKDFRAFIEKRRRRPEYVTRPLDQDILPAIGDHAIGDVTPLECRRIVEAVVARGSPTQAGAVLATLKQLFNFAWSRGDTSSNPTAPLRDPEALGVVRRTCDRFLSTDELAAFWKALDAQTGMTPVVRTGLKILLLTGVRSGELLQAEWGEVDFEAATWTIPVEHQKLSMRQAQRARPWVVPLSAQVLALFRELEGLAKALKSRFVMASFQGGGEATTEKALNHAMRRLLVGPKAVLQFAGERPTPHDLRRTLRTYLGDKLGVPFHVAERCLNHSLGKIAETYDRGDYLDERRAALEKWSAYVERLVAPGEAKVAFLAAQAVGPRG